MFKCSFVNGDLFRYIGCSKVCFLFVVVIDGIVFDDCIDVVVVVFCKVLLFDYDGGGFIIECGF